VLAVVLFMGTGSELRCSCW